MNWIKNNPTLAILLVGAAIFLPYLEVVPVTIMEARNFITAREMVVDGNWVMTTMNDLPRYEKPPLPSWITAVFGWLFGMDQVWALRFPTMLMAIVLAYVGYRLSLKVLNERENALINGLILLTSFYIIAITIEAPWDIYTHGFMLTGIYFLYLLFGETANTWKNSVLAGLFIGLSFMSKGPISFYGLLLPFLISYAFVFRYKGFKEHKKLFPVLLVILIAAIVGLWWFLYVRLADPTAFLAITKKETANWSSYNVRPFYYYWSFFVQSGIWTIPAFMGLLYPYLKNRISHKKAYKFTFWWTILSVVLLSLIPEKKARYLVPVLIPLALNTGIYLKYILINFKTTLNPKEKIPIYLHFGLIGTIGIAFPVASYFILDGKIGPVLFHYIVSSLVMAAIGTLLVIYLKKQRLFHCFILSTLLIAAIKSLASPLAGAVKKNLDYHSLSDLRETMAKTGIKTYNFGEMAPEMIWDYGSSIPAIKQEDHILVPNDDKFAILVVPAEESEFKRIFGPDHSYILKSVYDLNPNADPGTKKHKDRLVCNLYIVKKQ
ncbi:MAG TPA: glycosyltransferase family 39 protein, partial [Arenibacter sp.]|nr:glycosyltransferase family 39 protein [Arenibacter sp.]